jgi:hypothetical protein
MIVLTPRQVDLARHALGLNGARACSYRNHFVAGRGHEDHPDWMAMVQSGAAQRYDGQHVPFGGDDLFKLTRTGAVAALRTGEALDPEDFPTP